MAAPSYATDLVSVNADAESTTSWSALGGGGAGLSADPDFAIEPTNSITKQVTGAGTLKGMVYEFGSTRTQATNDHIYQWIYATCPGLIDTLANGGMRVSIGTSDTALMEYYIRGSAEYAAGGWVCEPVRYDSAVTPSPGRKLGTPGSAPSSFGGQIQTTGTIKAVNFSLDVCYEGSNIVVTAGDATTPATWVDLADYAYGTTRRWGVILPISGGAALQGKIYWGSGSTSCYHRDSNKLITFTDTPHSLTDLTEVHHQHASTDYIATGMTFLALGTNNRGAFIVDSSTNPDVDYTGSIFNGTNTFNAESNTILDECQFIGTNGVNAGGGASIKNAIFDSPTVGTDAGALVWNNTLDPDTYLDGTSFTQGTAAHHAIEFGTTLTDTEITLRNMDFTGFSGTGNDAALNFLRTSGTTTVNLVGCTGTITAKVTGSHTVTFVVNPVTTTITVKDADTLAAVSGAWVYLEASSAAGDLQYQATSTSWSRSGTVATVGWAAVHNLKIGQKVLIEPDTGSADASAYGIKTVATVPSTTSITYAMTDAGATTGVTVDATGVLISEVTTAGGIGNDTRSLGAAQPVTGWVRKHTSSPYYKQAQITATVSSTTGYDTTVLLISDE